MGRWLKLAACPLRVIFDQVVELNLRVDVRFEIESHQDHAAMQYVAMGNEPTQPLSPLA
jgi:hypothetical protein